MEVYVARDGEDIYGIGAGYGMEGELLAAQNGIHPSARMAEGQALCVYPPKGLHTVGQGETLAHIAVVCGVSPTELLRCNPQLGGRSGIYPGQRLALPQGEGVELPLHGRLHPALPVEAIYATLPYLTVGSCCGCRIDGGGTLLGEREAALSAAMRAYGVKPLLAVEDGGANGLVPRQWPWLQMECARQRTVTQLCAAANGYGGVHLQLHCPPDGVYIALLGQLRTALNATGKVLWVTLGPGQLYGLPEGLGRCLDMAILRPWESAAAYGPPTPLLPPAKAEAAVRTVLQVLTPAQTMLEIPTMALDWTLRADAGPAERLSVGDAAARAARFGASMIWEESAGACTFSYTAGATAHRVWAADVRSVLLYHSLAHTFGLAGISVGAVESNGGGAVLFALDSFGRR